MHKGQDQVNMVEVYLSHDDFTTMREVPKSPVLAHVYSKTCVKWPLKNRQNKDLNDKG